MWSGKEKRIGNFGLGITALLSGFLALKQFSVNLNPYGLEVAYSQPLKKPIKKSRKK